VKRIGVFLNFGIVVFLSSTMIGKLITLKRRVQTTAENISMCEMTPEIRELFDFMGLDKFFNITDTVDNAKSFFTKA